MTLHFLHLKETPILQQLQIEEALLRTTKKNYCIVNTKAPPAIVMGISGKTEELIHEAAFSTGIPVIKRYSGGGTVVVDEDTLFVSFLFNKNEHPFPAFPEPIYRWSESLYKKIFPQDFSLRENDYVLGDKKFGGNAQYIQRERWMHHSTFLWDYTKERMDLLKNPKRQPNYRSMREHSDFLCTLKSHFSSKEAFISSLRNSLEANYPLEDIALDTALAHMSTPHRKATTLVHPSA